MSLGTWSSSISFVMLLASTGRRSDSRSPPIPSVPCDRENDRFSRRTLPGCSAACTRRQPSSFSQMGRDMRISRGPRSFAGYSEEGDNRFDRGTIRRNDVDCADILLDILTRRHQPYQLLQLLRIISLSGCEPWNISYPRMPQMLSPSSPDVGLSKSTSR